MKSFGIPHTVQGWPADDIVTTVAIDDERERVEGYTHVVRRNTDASPVLLVPTVALTPVDTTPPEPEPGAWLIGTRPFIRQSTEDDTIHMRRWLGAGFHVRTWQEVWDTAGGSGITPRRLVPAQEPVPLPWSMDHGHAIVEIGPTLRLAAGCDVLHMVGDEAIGLGRALITAGERAVAARAAREATP